MVCPRFAVLLLLALALHTLAGADARYLPTRGQDDRLDRLRELIRDLLENEADKYSSNLAADPFAADRPFVTTYKQRQMPGRVVLSEEEK